ncbi:MAG TPA: hypothetical protein VMG09_14110, partial [Bacteroidota bacterium]|nr:hypothetical protein [Bacteroidota bacterium]
MKIASLAGDTSVLWTNNPQPSVHWDDINGGSVPFDICSDGAGGVYACWYLSTTGVLYAQWFDNTGTAHWGANGTIVCNIGLAISNPAISADPTGGVIVAWRDVRNGHRGALYAERISSAGSV